jgi:hypothetical protein
MSSHKSVVSSIPIISVLARRLLKPGLPTCLVDDGRRSPAVGHLSPIPNVFPPENEEFQIEHDATKKCASMGAQSFIEIGEDCIFSKRGCPDQRPLPFQSRQHSLPPTLKPTAAKSVHVHTQAPSGKRPHTPVVKSDRKALAAPCRRPSSRELPGLRMPLMTIDEFSEFNQGLHREPHFAPCLAKVTDVPCWASSAEDSRRNRYEYGEKRSSLSSRKCVNLPTSGIADPFRLHDSEDFHDSIPSTSSPSIPSRRYVGLALNTEPQTMSLHRSPTRPVRRLSIDKIPVGFTVWPIREGRADSSSLVAAKFLEVRPWLGSARML